jgi:hypothetical protein
LLTIDSLIGLRNSEPFQFIDDTIASSMKKEIG